MEERKKNVEEKKEGREARGSHPILEMTLFSVSTLKHTEKNEKKRRMRKDR